VVGGGYSVLVQPLSDGMAPLCLDEVGILRPLNNLNVFSKYFDSPRVFDGISRLRVANPYAGRERRGLEEAICSVQKRAYEPAEALAAHLGNGQTEEELALPKLVAAVSDSREVDEIQQFLGGTSFGGHGCHAKQAARMPPHTARRSASSRMQPAADKPC